MIERFLAYEKWEYAEEWYEVIKRDISSNSIALLDLSDNTPEGRENIRLVVAAPEMYKFLVKLLQDENFLRNPVQIALTAQKILMRIEGELNEVEK